MKSSACLLCFRIKLLEDSATLIVPMSPLDVGHPRRGLTLAEAALFSQGKSQGGLMSEPPALATSRWNGTSVLERGADSSPQMLRNGEPAPLPRSHHSPFFLKLLRVIDIVTLHSKYFLRTRAFSFHSVFCIPSARRGHRP